MSDCGEENGLSPAAGDAFPMRVDEEGDRNTASTPRTTPAVSQDGEGSREWQARRRERPVDAALREQRFTSSRANATSFAVQHRNVTKPRKALTLYTQKPRDENGVPLYSSDENTDDEFYTMKEDENDTDDRPSIAERESSVMDSAAELIVDEEEILASLGCPASAPLNYTAHFNCIAVELGEVVRVKRSDEDVDAINWPLFFVQLQKDELYDILEQHLDNIGSDSPIPEEQMAIGLLCVARSPGFNTMFRAVVTDIDGDKITVHFVDYGNYEVVSADDLRSIEDESDMTRTHAAMAIPCILKEVHENGDDLVEEEVKTLKGRVSCELNYFKLRFVRLRIDGIYVVEHVDG